MNHRTSGRSAATVAAIPFIAAFVAAGVVGAGTAVAVASPTPAPTPSTPSTATPVPTPGATPIGRPGGLLPGQAAPAASTACGATATTVCIVKSTSGPSCSGYSSQTTAPSTIRVLVHTPKVAIVTVPFQQYVENVLPNEWVSSWDGEALKAGAVAVRSYAWYWVTHYGGYLGKTNTPSTCFDVTDDTDFQVYRASSAQTRTTSAVVATANVAARSGGRIVQSFYRAYLSSSGEACGSHATGSTMSQYGTQTCAEAGYKYNQILGAYYYPGVQLASIRQQRTPDDFTFSQTSTRVLYNPSTGIWSVDDGYGTTVHYGVKGDIPAVTNAGDGFARITAFRPSTGTWYQIGVPGTASTLTHYGVAGDIPVAAHYNGSGSPTVLALFRPSTSTWWLKGSAGIQYGATGDIPVPGDYNGDGKTDIATYRPSTGMWWIKGTAAPIHYGVPGDIPVPGDYNGDGKTDIAMYRPSTGTWWIKGIASVHYGLATDIPVTGDYNSDGKIDFAVYRPSTHQWWVQGKSPVTFGSAGAAPIGAAPYRG